MTSFSTPSQRLGVKVIDVTSTIERFNRLWPARLADDPRAHPDNTGHIAPLSIAWLSISNTDLITKASFLKGEWGECCTWSRKLGKALEYYLFGDWMGKQEHDDGAIDTRRWFEENPAMTWVQYFDMDLGWVAVGRHWDDVDRILQFPQPRIAPDDDGLAARAYYLGLAQWWTDRNSIGWIDEMKQLRGAGSKGYHLLCDIVAGIADEDTADLQKSFPKYVNYFLKKRDHEEQFPMAATFLWNVAHRQGLTPELPEEIDKFLFRLPDEV